MSRLTLRCWCVACSKGCCDNNWPCSDTKGRVRRFFGLAKPERPTPDQESVPALSKSRHENFREHLLHSFSILGKGGYPLVYEGLWRELVVFAQHPLLQPFHDSGLDGFDIGRAEEE